MTPTRPLLPLVARFFETDPVNAAHSLETMPVEEAVDVVRALPPPLAAEAVRHLQPSHAASIVDHVEPEVLREIVNRLDPHRSAGLLMHLAPDRRARVLDMLTERKRGEVRELLAYPDDSAGRLMGTDFTALRSGTRVRDAVRAIRAQARKSAPMSYLYVLDENDRLVGVVTMRDLLLAVGDETLQAIMRRTVDAVSPFQDREEVIHVLTGKRYFAIPVVDGERRMLGVVKAEHLLAEVQEEASEDLQKMFGAGGDEHAFSPLRFSLAKRLPWLHINLLTAFLAAGVVGLFEDTIARITILAVFLPVVAGQGGNAGAQSLAVVIRGIVMREIPRPKIRAFVMKETVLGLINGVVIGLVTGGIAWAWNGNPSFGLVIGLAMVATLIAAGFSGAAIPLTMKSLGFDPIQSSSIILTTVTDVIGFFSFLGFATLFQQWLI